MTAASVRALSVEVCTDERAFAELAGEWGRLYGACRSVTPFQSHAWLHSWWLSYGTEGGLRLVLVRRHGELVAVAPLMRVRRPWPALVPIGGAISDFCDVLLDETAAAQGALALADALAELAGTALIDFREVRPGGAVERVYLCWRGPRHRVSDSACLELPALPMDQLIRRLPSARAQRIRNKVNKLTRLGVEWRLVGHDETEDALRRLLELHRLQWEGRKVSPEHLRPRFLEHLVRSAGPMVRSGEAVVREFTLDGAVVGVELTLVSRNLAGIYLYGVDPRLRERRADVATMLLRASTEHLVAEGASDVLSLLRGKEPYKYRWDPRTVVNQRFLLARRRTAPLLAAAAGEAAARGWAKKVLRRDATAGSPPVRPALPPPGPGVSAPPAGCSV
ncbi:CelD/BcsL family acetyltransferase involved in cellulose biosynthesis [Streptomyces griseochromogenes]|uniref:CelD/BcsL family acetyltransferase involved in cellulose biosynthesis n=1 Tax=Streptomyces griseochromogenes TaxID=68214 RepID=A0ABS4LSM9_9ACTN|nr:GNAT family N-acetyltransferase [Streptomyces griseochromogenes]MBP2050407.1 CelD/BcsL family acetyltransferase involved in cellulose biosynthesis [Streptomyces griseochromogenes]